MLTTYPLPLHATPAHVQGLMPSCQLASASPPFSQLPLNASSSRMSASLAPLLPVLLPSALLAPLLPVLLPPVAGSNSSSSELSVLFVLALLSGSGEAGCATDACASAASSKNRSSRGGASAPAAARAACSAAPACSVRWLKCLTCGCPRSRRHAYMLKNISKQLSANLGVPV